MQTSTSSRLSSRTWIVMFALALTEQIAWAVENSWFNTFVYDTITPDPRPIAWMVAGSAITATSNGQTGFVPVPIIFQVGSVISLLALIPLSFINDKK